jgi:hypothetical protein
MNIGNDKAAKIKNLIAKPFEKYTVNLL